MQLMRPPDAFIRSAQASLKIWVMAIASGSSFSATNDPAWVTPPFWKQICAQTPIASMSSRRGATS